MAHSATHRNLLQIEDVIPDAALESTDRDEFNHQAIAGRVAELALAARTPVNIALFGPWGSGKSSVYRSMRQCIVAANSRTSVVRYDAWKYGGQSLKRNFIHSIAKQLGRDSKKYNEQLTQSVESNTLDIAGWAKNNYRSLLSGLVLAVAISAAWLLVLSTARMLLLSTAFSTALAFNLSGAGTVLGLTLAAMLVGPKVLESVNVKVSRAPLQDADQFASTFEDLASDVTRKGKNRLIVFIDELDRCTPEDVVSTLVDLKTFLDQPHCIFVVAVDREVLERALRHVPQSNPLREDAPYYSTPGEFIDKIFQHQLSLPPLRTHALTRYARTLVESRSGLWLDLRRHQPRNRLLDDVVYTLIPKHVQSPRRVKVLLNNYATNVRIAQARGINWLDRAPEIAKLTVFQTEFPAFAADLLVQPRLPSLLLSPPDDISQSVKEILQRYSLDRLFKDGDDEHRSAAGELLQDTASPRASYHSAKNTVTLNLRSYLGRTRSAKIPDPRPDLLYLNVAVVIDGISNTELGEVIDFAAETDPVEVAEAFRGQPISAIRDAVRLLAERSDAEFGPGKANLIEAACRLAESLDAQELYQIAAIVSPSVLVASEDRTRADAIPGGLIVGAVGNNSAVIDHMLREIHRLDLDDPTLMRSSAALAYLSTEDATYIHEALVEIYTERPAPLHTALTQLPEREAIALWVSTKDAIDETLASLAKTPGPTETTRPSASVTAGGVPVLPEPDDGLKESTERFSQLLNSVEKRAQYSENLVWQVLRLGQLHAGPAESLFYQVVKQRASDVLPRMQYHAQRNSNVLWAIAYGPHSDWQWWIEFFDSSAKSEEVDLLKAASRLVKSISDPAIDVRSTMPILHTILSAPLSDERRAELLAELQSALTRLDWTDEDCRDRRTALYGVASVADGILEEPTDELLSDDILLAVRSSQHTDALVEQVITLVDALRPAAAGRVDDMLKEYEPPVGEGVSAMRMRIAVRKRSARDPLPIEELVSAATLDSASSSMTLISEWLDSRPEIRDVQRAIKALGFPRERELDRFAKSVSERARTDLWIDFEAADANPGVLLATGKYGVDSEAVSHIQGKLVSSPQQAQRDGLIERFRTATLPTPQARAVAAEMSLELLGTQVIGNAILAAKVAIHIEGPPRGHTEKLRTAFEEAVARKNDTFRGELRSKLEELRLIRPSRKGMIDRILGGGD